VGVHSFGIPSTTMQEYPWEIKGLQFPCSFKLGSEKKCPNTITPVIISYAYPEVLALGAEFKETGAESYSKELNLENFPFSSDDLNRFPSASISDGDSSRKIQSSPASSAPDDTSKQMPLSPDELLKKTINMEKSSIPEKMIGLEWFSNHCYANAVFQFLFVCKPISHFILNYSGENTFVKSLKILFQAMGKNKGNVILSEDKSDSIGLKTIYTVVGQEAKKMSTEKVLTELGINDQHEDAFNLFATIFALLSKVETDAVGQTETKSMESKLGVDIEKIKSGCINEMKHSNSMIHKNLPVLELELNGESIDECIKNFQETVSFDEKNMVFCEECKTNSCENLSYKIAKWPEILILHLKRFSSSGGLFFTRNDKYIAYNDQLEMYDDMQSIITVYKLKSVINHHGSSLDSGHYTTTLIGEDGKWYDVDSEKISIRNNGSFLASEDAYIFMYKKEKEEQLLSNADIQKKLENIEKKLQSKSSKFFTDKFKCDDFSPIFNGTKKSLKDLIDYLKSLTKRSMSKNIRKEFLGLLSGNDLEKIAAKKDVVAKFKPILEEVKKEHEKSKKLKILTKTSTETENTRTSETQTEIVTKEEKGTQTS
jgi:hypothetical protein